VYIIYLQILKNCLTYLQKMLLWRHFRLPKVPHFCQFMCNAFLGKLRLNQGKVIFCLKVILKNQQGAYMPPSPVLNRVKQCFRIEQALQHNHTLKEQLFEDIWWAYDILLMLCLWCFLCWFLWWCFYHGNRCNAPHVHCDTIIAMNVHNNPYVLWTCIISTVCAIVPVHNNRCMCIVILLLLWMTEFFSATRNISN